MKAVFLCLYFNALQFIPLRFYVIYEFHNIKTRANFNVTPNYDVTRAGHFLGTHAEVQALDDLTKQRFPIDEYPNGVSDEVFYNWVKKNDVLGYNRNIQYGVGQENVIMHTCADCFHILEFLTFIRP